VFYVAQKPALPVPSPKMQMKSLTPMDAEQKAKHAYKRDLIAQAYEMRFRKAAQDMFADELKELQKIKVGNAKADGIDWGQIFAEVERVLRESVAKWVNAFTPLIKMVFMDTVEQVAADFGISFNLKNPFVDTFINNYTPQFADGVISTTRNEIVINMLRKAQEEGWSIVELSKSIKDKYAGWDDWRATMIARTETIRASNAGALEAMRDAGMTRKQWLATNDARTRPAHMAADGQIVGMDEAFVVDGESLHYPGDRSGSAGNTINCRCTVIPVE
jgi:SPP1 gp7 family putative phage head morphogenesis protein